MKYRAALIVLKREGVAGDVELSGILEKNKQNSRAVNYSASLQTE